MTSTVQAKKARDLCAEKQAILIDVREPDEYQAERIDGALNIPLSQFDAERVLSQCASKHLIIQCASGKRALQASESLKNCSDAEVSVLENGIQGWKAAGLETRRSRAGISVMRQVQIIAGSLVFLGTVLGIFASELFLIIPAFVGAGLAVAGLTGWCGLAMLLGKMPWNKS